MFAWQRAIWPNFLGISGSFLGPGSGTPVVLGSWTWIPPTVQLRPLGDQMSFERWEFFCGSKMIQDDPR